MAKSTGQVTKIYELRTIGYDQLNKELSNVTKLFQEIKKAKLATQGKIDITADHTQLKLYSEEMVKLAIREQELRVETQRLTSEIKAEQLARQQAINEQRQKKAANDAEIGSIKALRNEIKELNAAIINRTEGGDINFRGQILQYDAAINKLKELTRAEQDFRRQFARDSLLVGEYTSGIVQAFKSLGLDDLVGGQITKASARINELDRDFEQLKQELSTVGVSGEGALQKIEKELIDNRKEAISLRAQVSQLQTDFRGTGDIGNQITSALKNGFRDARGQLAQFVLGFVGLQAALNGLLTSVDTAKNLADSTTNLEIELDKAAGGADKLVKNISKLDTRTKLTVLEEIANIAARAGVSEANLLGVTEAVDKIKIAFGKDFGDVEQGTESLVKLINIFLGTDQVTGDNLLRTGNAIRTLANESVASVPFLNDFSKRMAGLKGISDLSLPSVLGLASGFEQFGQSAEVSSTALVKIIPKLASDTQKYAQIAGLTNDAFKKLINDNPAEALIAVSQGLVQGKAGIEEISASFADSELGSGRIASVLGVLGKNADTFRKSIDSAATSFNDTSNIESAFIAKNENLAATLDKVSKRFSDAANSRGFQLTLIAIGNAILFLINNIPTILTLLGLLAANWVVQNAQLVLLRLQLIGYNAAIIVSQIAMGALSVIQTAFNAIMFVSQLAITGATRALAFFGITIRATTGPLGIILTILGVVAAAYAAFAKGVDNSIRGLSEFARQQRVNIDINRRAAQTIQDNRSAIDGWVAVIKSATSSADTKARAVAELTKINKAFNGVIKDGTVDLQALDLAYQQVIKSIGAKARAEAAAALSAKRQKDVVAIAGLRQDLEIQTARATGTTIDVELTDEQKNLLRQSNLFETGAIVQFTDNGAQIFRSRFEQIKKFLVQKQEEAKVIYGDYLKVQLQTAKELEDVEKSIADENNANKSRVAGIIEVDIAAIQSRLKEVNELLENFQGSKATLNKLLQERTQLQSKLDGLLNKSQGSSGSRLTGDQKDRLKEIDSTRDKLLADEEKKRLQNEISEGEYLRNILAINQQAIDDKLAFIGQSNAEELKQRSQLQLERVKIERETSDKLQAIAQKQVDDIIKSLELERDAKITAAKAASDEIINNPTSTETQRAQAKLDADNQILEAQLVFGRQLDLLEKTIGAQTVKNVQDTAEEVRKTRQQILTDRKGVSEGILRDNDIDARKEIAKENAKAAELRKAVLDNDKLTFDQKQKQLEKLELAQKRTILSIELNKLLKDLEEKKKLFDASLLSEVDYLEAFEAVRNKAAEVSAASPENTDKKKGLFGLEAGSEKEAIVNFAVAESFNFAKEAMTSYFSAERAEIQKTLDKQLERLETEKQGALKRARSRQDELRIEKEFNDRKRQLEKNAFEQVKKAKKAEARFALVAELANIAVAAANPAANAATFGAYAPIYYAIQSAIAIGRYALRIGEINRETFAYGGQPGDVPTRGGEFGGKPHSEGGTPFEFKGQQYEAEVDELSIIRTRNAARNRIFQVVGTQKQIASAMNVAGGGISFAPGAKIKTFAQGGNLGESLQPPVFIPTNNTTILSGGGVTKEDFQEFYDRLEQLTIEQSRRIDRLEVVQVTSTVTNAQKKEAKQNEIGTL